MMGKPQQSLYSNKNSRFWGETKTQFFAVEVLPAENQLWLDKG
jgi:hypothetical protein